MQQQDRVIVMLASFDLYQYAHVSGGLRARAERTLMPTVQPDE